MPYVTTDLARDHLTGLWKDATTVLLGRVNAAGFMGFWPSVAVDESADARDRAFATWLVDAEKVVLSTTLTQPPWDRTRIVNAPDGLPASTWALATESTGGNGAISLIYDRIR